MCLLLTKDQPSNLFACSLCWGLNTWPPAWGLLAPLVFILINEPSLLKTAKTIEQHKFNDVDKGPEECHLHPLFIASTSMFQLYKHL